MNSERKSSGSLLSLLSSVAIVFSLVGCTANTGSSAPFISPSPSVATEPQELPATYPASPATAVSAPADASARQAPAKSYNLRVKDSAGYALSYTISWYRPIRGSETVALNAAWKSAGATQQMECMAMGQGSWASVFGTPATREVWIGTVTIVNETPDFDPPWAAIQFSKDFNGLEVGYSNGSDCADIGSSGGRTVNAKWESGAKRWGPTPIAVFVSDAYGPKYPNGKPEVRSGVSVIASSGVESVKMTLPSRV